MKDIYRTLSLNKAVEFPKHFGVADKLYELADLVMANLQHRSLHRGDLNLYQIILMFNCYKAGSSFQSVCALCNQGTLGDAKTICRKLLELAIHMKYLSLDPSTRDKQYWHRLSLKADYDIRTVNKNPEYFAEFIQEELREMASAVEERKEEATKYWDKDETGKIKGDFKRFWSGKSLAAMAKECGLGFAYYHPYLRYCVSTHGSVDDVLNYVDFEKLEFGPFFEVDDIPIVIYEASKAFSIILKLIVDAFEMDLSGSLESIEEELETLHAA